MLTIGSPLPERNPSTVPLCHLLVMTWLVDWLVINLLFV